MQSSAYANAVLADGPARYYRLNDQSGPSAFESAGTQDDGTYDGPVIFGVQGPLLDESSTAVATNGGAYDVGVRIPAALSNAGSYSIETWIRPDLSKSYMTIWGYSTSHRLLVNPSGYLLSQFSGNYTSKHALSDNSWHDVVFVYDASSGTQSYYIDGALDSSSALSASAASFTSPYYLGEYDTSGNYKWHGSIAEHAVYAYALSASQVLAHYNAAGYPPAAPTPQPTSAPTPAADAPCAGYRWSIKVATDADASKIQLSPVQQTTMTWLTGIPKPNTEDTLPRLLPTEGTPYELSNVTVTEVFHAVDQDYHLVLKDAEGHTMIAESPDPACAPNSTLYTQIQSVHQQIAQHYPAISSTPMQVSDTITLEGVPFFDYVPNYATGESDDGIEIHPILGICFGANCSLSTPAPAPTTTPASSSAYGSALLADAPHEYYPLEETSGPTVDDASGNSLNGSYAGPVTYGVAGPLRDESSTAVSLSGGTASVGALLPNPNAAAGTAYTIELWVDPAPSSTYMTLWGYNGTHRLLISSTGLLLSQFSGNFFSKGALTRNAWHLIDFVYDPSVQTASYYIDGALDSSASVAASAAAFTSQYYLGQYDTGTSYKWNGRMAQAAFYGSALTPTQIAAHYSDAGYGSAATPAPTAAPTAAPTPTTATPTPIPSASPGTSYQSTVLAQSPAQYLQLNDASGSTAADSSGNGQNGTYLGSVTYGVAGPLKTSSSAAISLPGTAASEGVSVPNPSAPAGTSYSIELWIDAAPSSTYMTLWGYSGTHRLLLSDTGLLLTQLDGNFSSKTALSRNVWHQVVFVYDASTQTASYYVDGALDSTASIPAGAAAFTSAYYLGQYDTGKYYKWNGRLAQPAFYRTALTAAQIAQHYSAAGY